MQSTKNLLSQWTAMNLSLATANQDVLIDADAVERLTVSVIDNLDCDPDPQAQSSAAVRELVHLFICDQQDEHRGVIGNLTVRTTAINVAGGVLATIAIVSWLTHDPSLFSISSTVTFLSALQTAVSAISVLSPKEREVISLVLAAERLNRDTAFTLDDLLNTLPKNQNDRTRIVALLSRLCERGALVWAGGEQDNISVKKWF